MGGWVAWWVDWLSRQDDEWFKAGGWVGEWEWVYEQISGKIHKVLWHDIVGIKTVCSNLSKIYGTDKIKKIQCHEKNLVITTASPIV